MLKYAQSSGIHRAEPWASRELAMRTRTLKIGDATLDELLEGTHLPNQGAKEICLAWVKTFAGKSRANSPFRIVAVDNKNELLFGNLELLRRFATIPLPSQEVFLQNLRAAFEEHGVETIHLAVRWSENKKRIIQIRAPHDCEILEFDLL